MPDVEKLFAQQHPPEQAASINVGVVSFDVSSSNATTLESSASPVSAGVHHCPAVSKSFLEADVDSGRDCVGENQISLSGLRSDDVVQVHSASLNCQGPAGEVASEEEATRAIDPSFSPIIDPTMLLTLLAEEADDENGDTGGFVPISGEHIEDENASVLAETISSAARFGGGHGKFVHQAPNGNSNGSHLATVLENLPLPMESSTQNSDQDNTCMRSSSPVATGSSNGESHAGAIGHSRSAHSFGPADSLAIAYFAQQQQTSENRRTHARHSSYEVPSSTQQRSNNGQNVSACLNGILAPSATSGLSGACFAPFGRTNSLSRTGTDASSFSSSFSISSLSYSDYSASLASITDSNGGDSQPHFFHQHPQDENSSKRSSLDRRSLTSYCSSSSNDDGGCTGSGFGQRLNDVVSGTTTAGGDSSGTTGNHKRLLPLTNILPRSLFSRKTLTITPSNGQSRNENANDHATTNGSNQNHGTSWKLPFRPPAALASTLGSALSLSLSSSSLASSHLAGKNHNVNKELAADAPSTTALILQDRPATLPPKSAEEEQKHRQLYEQMIEAAKKKEQREAKQRKKQQRLQLKQEEALSAAVKEWTTEILPRWDEVKHTKRVRELWGQGLPPCVRGKVWKLAVGNELSITEELFEICVNRAKERLRQFEEASAHGGASPNGASHSSSPILFNTPPTSPSSTTTMSTAVESPVDREGTVELIHLDVARTFPVLGIFQKGGPYYDLLLNVLGAYACYRPDVGYVQGMSFLAAVLLLNMDAPDTFIVFANLMNRPCQLAFFRLRQAEMERYFLAYDRYFHECLPKLYAHFKQLDVRPNLYLIEWLYTLYAKSLPLEVTCRIWDTFVRDGEEFLFRTAIGILHLYEDVLLRADFDRCVQFLTHLPDNVRACELFRSTDEAAPAAASSFSFCPSSVRHSTCGGGGGGEKKRFMHFFNELGDNRASSAAASGCSSPTAVHNHLNQTPSLLFTYAANFLSSNTNHNSPNTTSVASGRRESAGRKNADESENGEHHEETVPSTSGEGKIMNGLGNGSENQPESDEGEAEGGATRTICHL